MKLSFFYKILLGMFVINAAFANIGSDLENYVNNLGITSNTTNPAAYHSQQAGLYTGGSYVMRSKSRDVQLMQITLPSYNTGCAGINLFGGSVTILSQNEIKEALQNVMSNAVNYAATLTLETITPMIAKNAEYWKDYVDKINRLSINSCEMAEGLVGGVWPKMRGAQQRICQDVSNTHNMFGSWAQSRQGCATDDDKISNVAKNDSRFKDILLDGNLVWKAIQKQSFLKGDTELAELFMSLTGTIVITKEGNSVSKKPYPALANQSDLIDALLNGKTTNLYHCDETTQCLHVSIKEKSISPANAFKSKITRMLNGIAEKVKSDTALSEAEQGLIASTSLPILKMVTVMDAYLKDDSLPNLDAYAEVIALDILYQYLHEALSIVKTSLAALPLTEELTKNIEDDIEKSLIALRAKQAQIGRQVEITIQMVTQSQAIERMLIGEFSSDLANTITWAKGLK